MHVCSQTVNADSCGALGGRQHVSGGAQTDFSLRQTEVCSWREKQRSASLHTDSEF